MRVCLLTEGTYPFVRGGVSTWCHELIAGLPEIEFVVYALIGSPGVTAEYVLPPNISRLVAVPLYGHHGLRDYNRRDLGPQRKRTSMRALRADNTRWEKFYGVDPERIDVVYNGVDEKRFADRERSPERPTVAAVLRIDPLKDVPTMIASAAIVRETIPNVAFKIWGPAPDREYFELCKNLVAELDLGETVEFMGSTADPAAAYADSHIVALSSISEGFPYTIIEAMMSAKPVVATDVGGVREAVDRFGFVVPPKNPQRFGEAIAQLLANPAETKALGKAARTFALERFTQRTFLENYRALYAARPRATAAVPA